MELPKLLIILFCLLLSVAAKVVDSSGCEPFSNSSTKLMSSWLTLDRPSLILASPNYGDGRLYAANATCTRRIFAPRNYQIKVEFINSSYDIETSLYSICKYDMLEVRDGATPYSPILGRFCSRTASAVVMSSRSNAVYLRFLSDSTIEGMGFQLHISIFRTPSTIMVANTVANVCRYQVTREDGIINLRDSAFRNVLLAHLGEMIATGTVPENEDHLIDCNLDIEPTINDVAFILIKLDFQASIPIIRGSPCQVHQFQVYDLGMLTYSGKQLPPDPEVLSNVCTPKRDIIIVTKTSQATIRVSLMSSLLLNNQQQFQTLIEYAVLSPPERCLHLAPPLNSNENNNVNVNIASRSNKTVNGTAVIKREAADVTSTTTITAAVVSNVTTMKAMLKGTTTPNLGLGIWCSIVAVTVDSVSLLCLHPSLRCNGRNNCPSLSSVSVDELNCYSGPVTPQGGVALQEDDENQFLPQSELLVKYLLYASVSFIGLVLSVGLGILAFRKLAFFVIKNEQNKMQRQKAVEATPNKLSPQQPHERIINCRKPPPEKKPCSCCRLLFCLNSSSQGSNTKRQQLKIAQKLTENGGSIPSVAAARMTSIYRNQHSSPAFRCSFCKVVNRNNNNNYNRQFRKNGRKQLLASSSSEQSSSAATAENHLLLKRNNNYNNNEIRYHSGSLYFTSNNNRHVNSKYDDNDEDSLQNTAAKPLIVNERLVKSSQNVVSAWLTKNDLDRVKVNQQQSVHFMIPAGKAKPMLPVPPITVTTLRDVSLKLSPPCRRRNGDDDDEQISNQQIFGSRYSPPTPFKNDSSIVIKEEPSDLLQSDKSDNEEDSLQLPSPPTPPVMARLSDFVLQQQQDLTRSLPPASSEDDDQQNAILSARAHQYCFFSNQQPSITFRHPAGINQITQSSYSGEEREEQNSFDSLMLPQERSAVKAIDHLDRTADGRCSDV